MSSTKGKSDEASTRAFDHRLPFPRCARRRTGGLALTCATPEALPGGGGQSLPNTNPYSQAFTTFESGQVRPLAFTPNKQLLLATNTPDAKLEVYEVKQNGDLEHVVSVPVGLEPVAVAARTNQEAWVVNHLSDSVSIVKLDGKKSYVTRTLLVGDEPRDIVFAGPDKSNAFITTAHRGQNSRSTRNSPPRGRSRRCLGLRRCQRLATAGAWAGLPSRS